jgi:hypothetical protein
MPDNKELVPIRRCTVESRIDITIRPIDAKLHDAKENLIRFWLWRGDIG